MAQLANVLDDDEKAQLAKDQQAAGNQAWRKSSFLSVDSAKSNAITVAVAAMTVAFPPMALVAIARLAANAMNANKAADAARKEAEKEFMARQQTALALESQKLDIAIKRQQLENGGQQSARVQMPKEEVKIVMPNQKQPEAEPIKRAKTTEIENPDAATPEQVTKAQAAVLESPLNETLGAAQQGADGKIARPVLDVNALLAQTKTNAQGIDAKIDAAMGKSHTDKDVMESLNKFTEKLIDNMQQRGLASTTKEEQGTDAYKVRFAQAVQDSMKQAGAYKLSTKVEDGAQRQYTLETPLAAGKIGRNVGNSANYALNGVEKDFNNHEPLMNKAAGLSAIQNQTAFKDENGKFNAAKVAEAFEKGEFNSFQGNDKRIAALYDAAKMVAEDYKQQQAEAAKAKEVEQPVAEVKSPENEKETVEQFTSVPTFIGVNSIGY